MRRTFVVILSAPRGAGRPGPSYAKGAVLYELARRPPYDPGGVRKWSACPSLLCGEPPLLALSTFSNLVDESTVRARTYHLGITKLELGDDWLSAMASSAIAARAMEEHAALEFLWLSSAEVDIGDPKQVDHWKLKPAIDLPYKMCCAGLLAESLSKCAKWWRVPVAHEDGIPRLPLVIAKSQENDPLGHFDEESEHEGWDFSFEKTARDQWTVLRGAEREAIAHIDLLRADTIGDAREAIDDWAEDRSFDPDEPHPVTWDEERVDPDPLPAVPSTEKKPSWVLAAVVLLVVGLGLIAAVKNLDRGREDLTPPIGRDAATIGHDARIAGAPDVAVVRPDPPPPRPSADAGVSATPPVVVSTDAGPAPTPKSRPKKAFISYDRWAQDNLPAYIHGMATRCASKCSEPGGPRATSCHQQQTASACRAFDTVRNKGIAIRCGGKLGHVGCVVDDVGECTEAFKTGWCE